MCKLGAITSLFQLATDESRSRSALASKVLESTDDRETIEFYAEYLDEGGEDTDEILQKVRPARTRIRAFQNRPDILVVRPPLQAALEAVPAPPTRDTTTHRTSSRNERTPLLTPVVITGITGVVKSAIELWGSFFNAKAARAEADTQRARADADRSGLIWEQMKQMGILAVSGVASLAGQVLVKKFVG
jgi:hypothetical protein